MKSRIAQTLVGLALAALWVFADQLGLGEYKAELLGLAGVLMPSAVTIGRGVRQYLDRRSAAVAGALAVLLVSGCAASVQLNRAANMTAYGLQFSDIALSSPVVAKASEACKLDEKRAEQCAELDKVLRQLEEQRAHAGEIVDLMRDLADVLERMEASAK